MVGSKLLRSQVSHPGALVLNRLFTPNAMPTCLKKRRLAAIADSKCSTARPRTYRITFIGRKSLMGGSHTVIADEVISLEEERAVSRGNAP